jgi:hypothetical protein
VEIIQRPASLRPKAMGRGGHKRFITFIIPQHQETQRVGRCTEDLRCVGRLLSESRHYAISIVSEEFSKFAR